jgi:muramidase (phage lysozyme)
LNFSFAELAPTQCYKLLCELTAPRPIALVTSISPADAANAAPSLFLMCSQSFDVFSEHPALSVLGPPPMSGSATGLSSSASATRAGRQKAPG